MGERFKGTLRKIFYMTAGIGLATALYWVWSDNDLSWSFYQWLWVIWGIAVLTILVVSDKK